MMISKPAFLIPLVIFMGMAGFVLAESADPPVIENPATNVMLYCAEPVAVAPLITIENIQVSKESDGI